MNHTLQLHPRVLSSLLAVFTALLAFAGSAIAQQPGTSPVKIFIMAGQSNMLGKGTISPVTTPGTLDYIVANEPGKYQFLKSGGSYAVRDDVWIRDQDPVLGGLTVGFGGEAAGLIGPELGFGHTMGDVDESQILIVKCAWGGRDLAFNFCPPSSRIGEPAPVTSADKGFYYKEVLRLVNEAKTNLGTYFLNYNGGGYQIAGMCWHQGYNDRIDAARSAAYQTNMANFINDIRNDLAAPNMPFVIATTGMDGLSGYGYTQVEKAQLKMADTTAYPAFAGNVAVVDTRGTYDGLDFWQSVSASPADEGYHWNRNAKTYLHIGLAMGDAMSLMAPGRCPYRPRANGGSGGVTLTWKNGTEIPTSVRVLRNGVQIAAAAPANPASFLDATAPLGVNNYELQFTMPGNPCTPLTLSHNSGVTGLTASQRINGLNLSWESNLSYTAIQVKRNGSVIAASLPGSATRYVDFSPLAGAVTYSVEPTDAGSTPAQVQVTVSSAPPGTALIYEPFDMTSGAPLNSNNGGIGLDRQWVAGSTVEVASGSLTFGTLPTFGNRIIRTSGNGSCSTDIGTTLSEAGLMDHGAELWFSFLCPNPNDINVSPTLVLGNEALGNATTVANSGSAIGVRINQGKTVQGMVYNGGGTAATSNTQTTLAASELALVVGHITWGANPAAPDTIQIYTPGTNFVLDTPQSTSAVVDQSTFRVLSMWGNGTAPTMDEIRFGATYKDVIGQGVDTSGDQTPPTPPTMSFSSPPAAFFDSSVTMTATTATDDNGVQYFFACTGGGGHDSGWQDSPVYTDTGLSANTLYSYTVQARDKSINRNTNTASSAASATTLPPDTNPPPTPGFATTPTPLSSTEISMTASTVVDPEGGPVEYRFMNTTLATNSGWQADTTFTDSNLTPSTTYLYTVQARDKAAVPNETAFSSPQSAITFGASSGIWKFDADGTWSDSSKWIDNVVAIGSGATAFFTQNITAGRIISLDAPHTIGNITFTDATTSSNDLSIAGSGVLILDVLSGAPVIDVTQSGRTLTINNVITGSKGLQKNGPGRLVPNNSNTYSGITTVTDGQLDLTNVSLAGFGGGIGGGRNIMVSSGAAIRRNLLDNAFLNRLVETNDEIGVFTGATSNHLDFSSSTGANLPSAFLGNWAGNGAKCEYNGILTPASDAYRLGFPTANGLLGMRQPLTGTQGLIVGGGRVQLVNAGNTFSGDTVIRTGAKLTLGNNLALQNSALDLGAAGGSFALNNSANNITGSTVSASPTFGGLKGSRNLLSAFTNAGGNNESNLTSNRVLGFTLNPDTGNFHTYSGIISDFASGVSLPMTKTGSGSQEFAGSNSYTGTTTVSGGTLKISHANGLAFGGRVTTSPGTTTVNSGATVDLNGIPGINEPIVLNGNGVGGDGALVNHSVSPAGISNGIAALTLPATGSGSGYGTTVPTVTIGGTGSGATATAFLGLTTASITSVTGGAGWAVGDTMIINNASGNGAIAQVTGVSSGAVTGLSIIKAGAGFTAVTSMTIAKLTGASTSNPSITWNSTNFTVGAIQLTNAGSGYAGTPTVTFSTGNASNSDVVKTLSSVVLASGSSIGGSGNITINGAVSESGGARALTKVGAGTLTVTNANTYTGTTSVNQGTLALVGGSQKSPITVAGGASLGFTLGSPTTSTSSVNLTNGTVKITGAVDNSSDYLLMTASTITGTPALASPIANYQLQKTAGSTELKLVHTSGSAYDTWKSTNAPTGNPDNDSDGDGVSNAVEFVLGGLATTNDLGKLPAVSTSGGNLLFTFLRKQSSIDPGKTTVTIEVGTDLVTWPSPSPYAVPNADTGAVISPGVTVVAGVPAGFDTVTLRVPQDTDKKFARLKVVITP